ncbi:MAG: phage holin family protein [Actinobacteria bacterium]|nr:phage holin family protein [Actinomycetota bacterium]
MATAAPEGNTPRPAARPAEASAAARVAARENEPTIGGLVNDALKDVSSLVRSEIELAKVEITADVKKGGQGAAFFIVAGVLAVFGLTFLFHTLAWAIAVFLPTWAGYLIVTVLLFLIAGILAMLGKGRIAKVKGKPERTIVTAKETVEVVKAAAQG